MRVLTMPSICITALSSLSFCPESAATEAQAPTTGGSAPDVRATDAVSETLRLRGKQQASSFGHPNGRMESLMGIVWRREVPSTVRKPLEGSTNRKARVGSVRFRGGPRSLWRRGDLGRIAKDCKNSQKSTAVFFFLSRGASCWTGPWPGVRYRSSRTPHHSHSRSVSSNGVGMRNAAATRGGSPETPGGGANRAPP
ncbi:hypothetical protein C8Q74DRAFT_1045798 [Fomes fomentarius]|nr:hypothetical protein C8Q74DRAFT_1045798 [Fomes fomentarius]